MAQHYLERIERITSHLYPQPLTEGENHLEHIAGVGPVTVANKGRVRVLRIQVKQPASAQSGRY